MGAFVSFDSVEMNRFILSAGSQSRSERQSQKMLNLGRDYLYKTEDQTFRLSFLQAFRNRRIQSTVTSFRCCPLLDLGATVAEALFSSYFVGRDFDTLEEFPN